MPQPKPLHELGDLQRSVMELVWDRGEATVHELRDALSDGQERSPAYTTVLSVLQKLEKAGWVKHRSKGRTYLWSAARTRESEGRSSLGKYIDHVFRGDPLLLMQHLLADDRLGAGELDELRQMVEQRRMECSDD